MKTIPLTQGRSALVDDEDYELLSRHTWCAVKVKASDIWYAATNIVKNPTRMHVMVMGYVKGTEIHHDDHNGLNNQKGNLKRTTHAKNIAHQKRQKRNASGFKGVSWDAVNKKWVAQAGRSGFIGRFDTIIEAAKAYDATAKKKWGEFALTNRMLGLLPKSNA
jgi:hypothetical protein